MFTGQVNIETWTADVSFGYMFATNGNFVPDVNFGLGGGFSTLNGAGQIPGNNVEFRNFTRDSFTLNVGVGLRILLGRTIYLRPLVRARWFEKRIDDDIDLEATLAIGFRFGGRVTM